MLGVVVTHTLDADRHPWSEYGGLGVQLFFVLSGFLITGILLDARRDAEALGVAGRTVLRPFYARRALRIFPVYYTTLAVATLLGVSGMRDHLGWNLVYLSNWKVAADGQFGAVTHIWSLAVEEQFYLLWPLVVLLAPRRALSWATGAMIGIALATRVVLTVATDLWADGIGILTPSVLDSLGLGALLALLWRLNTEPSADNADNMSRLDRRIDRLAVLGVTLWIVEVINGRWGPSRSAVGAFTVIWWSIIFMWIVHRTARGRTGVFGRVLTFRPIAFIGTISYGIYLFHLFVVPVAQIVESRVGIDLPVPVSRGPAQFVAVATASIAVAAVSWTWFEHPINCVKRRFPYVPAAAVGSAAEDATHSRDTDAVGAERSDGQQPG